MDYKQKYEEALEWARKVMQGKVGFVRDEVLEKFPELKESEDERIRKELIAMVKLSCTNGDDVDKKIAWLEKQGEKEPKELFDIPENGIENDVSVTSRMEHVPEHLKSIAKFIIEYAHWNLHKDEWNHPVPEVPLFRVLDALVQEGKPYQGTCSCVEQKGTVKWSDKDDLRYCIDYVNPRHPTLDNGNVNILHYRIPSFVGDNGAESILTVILSFGAKIVRLYRGNVRDGELEKWDTPMIVDDEDWYTDDWLKSLKDRVQLQPQPWNPWEKQMKTFQEWIEDNRYQGDARYVWPILNHC